MADVENMNVNETEPTVVEQNTQVGLETNKPDDQTESLEVLKARIAALEVSNKKLKSQNDKMSAAEADRKRKEREQMTADQQAEIARLEAEEQQKQYVADLEKFQKKTLAKDRYLLQGMTPELAEKAAQAELDGDMDSLSVIQKQHSDSALKAARAEWMRSRPDVNAGTGENKITKEQFAAMDLVEKSKLKRENPDEYERLKSL